MLSVTTQNGPMLIAIKEIVYAFEVSSGCELITLSSPKKSIKIEEEITAVRSAGLAAVVSNGVEYAVNPANCRHVLRNNAGGALIVTESGEIESDSYSDVVLAFASVGTGPLPGPYTGDSAAAAGGVPLGGQYRLSQVNDYDLPSPGGRSTAVRVA